MVGFQGNSSFLEAFPEVAHLLKTQYSLVAQFGPFLIYGIQPKDWREVENTLSYLIQLQLTWISGSTVFQNDEETEGKPAATHPFLNTTSYYLIGIGRYSNPAGVVVTW